MASVPSILMRICSTEWAHSEPSFRASKSYRFDSPNKSFGTLYCAEHFDICLMEAVVRDRSERQLSVAEVDEKSLTLLNIDCEKVKVVDFTAHGGASLGLDAARMHLPKYGYTQRLAKMIHDHADQPSGIKYLSRFLPGQPAYVFFERAKASIKVLSDTKPIPLRRIPWVMSSAATQLGLTLIARHAP